MISINAISTVTKDCIKWTVFEPNGSAVAQGESTDRVHALADIQAAMAEYVAGNMGQDGFL